MWPLLAGVLLAAQSIPPVDPVEAPPPVRGMVDWQAHPAMHLSWRFFGTGLEPDLKGRPRTWRHLFKQVMSEPQLRASGVRILHAAALAGERARNREHAIRLVHEQIAFIDNFAAEHAEEYAVARSPEEARAILNNGTKMVLVHAIEGGRFLFDEPGDAAYWASQGVSLVTLIHLFDDSLGTSAINPDPIGPWLNPSGVRRRRFHPERQTGLTERGRAAIVELAEAGILLDLSHMSPHSVVDALEVCRAQKIPPVVTHGMFAPIQDSERAFSEAQVLEIYKLGGSFSTPLNGGVLEPIRPTLAIPEGIRWGTREAFKFHAETLDAFLRANAEVITGAPWEALDEAGRTRLSFGWSSDWNGWTNHNRPSPSADPELRARGLAHPGLLPALWRDLEADGMDLGPYDRSAEHFLQIWEAVRAWSPPG